MRSSLSASLTLALLATVNAQSSSSSFSAAATTTTAAAAGSASGSASVGSSGVVDAAGSSTGTASAAAASTTLTNSGSNPFIPSSISSSCQSFLEILNADKAISDCTSSALSALSAFVPSTSQSSYGASSSDVDSALTSFCSSSTCSSSTIRNNLNWFNGNCSAELQSANSVVLGQFDVLYLLTPFTSAVCSKDSTGGFCVEDIVNGQVPTNSSTSSNSTAAVSKSASNFNIATYAGDALKPQSIFNLVSSTATRLVRRAVGDASLLAVTGNATTTTANSTAGSNTTASVASTGTTGLLPNTATWSSASLPFIFLSPNMSSSILCTTCTKTILASYVAWESSSPYPLGLSNSPMLGSQGTLWSGIGSVCGSGFLESTAQQAGQSDLGSGSLPSTKLAVATLSLSFLVSLILI